MSYTYGTETGKKFQLANVKDVNYRTEETPSESENVNNNHAYEYDANGNLVYVNTSRTKKNGVADEKTVERKLKWDEENRLLASDATGRMRIGHTGVIVENYKLKTTASGVKQYESMGTYTYYDLWPSSANLGGKAAVQDVEAVYNSQSFYMITNGKKNADHSALERYISKHDMSQLPGMLQNNFSENSIEDYGEGYAPDGIIRLEITGEQTYHLQQEYISLIKQGTPYNGESNNCTTFVANGINNSGIGSVKEERIVDWRGLLINLNPFHKSFTPNNTYNQLKNSPISVVVKSAGNKTSESYEDAIIDR